MAWAMSGPPVLPKDPLYWLGAGWLALAGSVVTFPLYFKLVREIGASRAAYNSVVVVVLAMLISTLLEGYRWTGLAVAGSLLAMAGLVTALSGRN